MSPLAWLAVGGAYVALTVGAYYVALLLMRFNGRAYPEDRS